VEHVDVAEVADCVVIAPATADLMARMVHGEAPDALTCLVLASSAPLVIAPAMDVTMWRAEATRANVRALRSLGARIVDPVSGPLASGLSGPGRLAEIADIVAAVEGAVERRESLKGVRVLVGAGRTEEALDPVRVLTNRSTGRMGFAIAEAARDRGADVTLVAGPVSVEPPHGVTLVRVTTALEMQRALQAEAAAAHVIVMAAAVADHRPVKLSREKLKRTAGPVALTLTPNPDILAGLGASRVAGQVLVGFALETRDGVANARAKRKAKGVDLIVLNSPEDGIGTETNRVTLVDDSSAAELPKANKREVAEAILDRVIALGGKARPARRGAKTAAPRRARKAAAKAAKAAPPARGRAPKGRAR
jgi:phosphopantothenoylcysteine decarboxylase/phosphopantothenate--cysteine ligase